MKYFPKWSVILALAIVMTGNPQKINAQKSGATVEEINSILAQFAPTDIQYDSTLLDENQKKIVGKLYQAAVIIDSIYLDQVYSKNVEIKHELQNSDAKRSKSALKLFNIMFGPFNRLHHDKPFYGKETKPKGANFYPEDMTKEEFNNWIQENPEDEEAFTSEYTIIRREGDSLIAIPYSEFYQDRLTKISALLRDAAQYADNPSLKKYLNLRADALLSNDYYQSDLAWMDLKDHRIDVVIGPIEVYEDGLFNYKASFESFITIRDPEASKQLARFGKYLTDLEKNLPIPEKYKNYERGSESPIEVTQEVFTAGEAKAGVQTLAFNLPNDERVRKAKGSKKVMLKNINEAKFEKLLQPIATQVLEPDQLKYVTFDAFFDHGLMHEMSHGIGPGFIKVNGEKMEVKKALKETYSTIEECKADVLGMYNNKYMVKQGEYPESMEKEFWVSFLAGIFRSVRFGVNEAHGAGNAIIYNYLLENGGYSYDAKHQKVKVNFDKVYDVTKQLAFKLLTIQAEGDYEGAKAVVEKYGVMSPSMKSLTAKLEDLPVDIKPVYQIEETSK